MVICVYLQVFGGMAGIEGCVDADETVGEWNTICCVLIWFWCFESVFECVLCQSCHICCSWSVWESHKPQEYVFPLFLTLFCDRAPSQWSQCPHHVWLLSQHVPVTRFQSHPHRGGGPGDARQTETAHTEGETCAGFHPTAQKEGCCSICCASASGRR